MDRGLIMLEQKRIAEYPKWLTREERAGRFAASLPPHKKETRRPLLWIAQEGAEMYLINATGETLDLVTAGAGGFQTIDDGVMSVSSKSRYQYEAVRPNEAVKVEEYDRVLDSDYMLQIDVEVKSAKLGYAQISTPAKKGGVGETVLLWDSGEPGKDVRITQK